jgi:hypothetical protein
VNVNENIEDIIYSGGRCLEASTRISSGDTVILDNKRPSYKLKAINSSGYTERT